MGLSTRQLMTWQLDLAEWASEMAGHRECKMEVTVFLDFILEVISHHFHSSLFARRTSLGAVHTKGGGVTQGMNTWREGLLEVILQVWLLAGYGLRLQGQIQRTLYMLPPFWPFRSLSLIPHPHFEMLSSLRLHSTLLSHLSLTPFLSPSLLLFLLLPTKYVASKQVQ